MEIEMKKEREIWTEREREARAAKEFNFDQAAKLKQRHLAASGGDCGRSLLAVALAVKRLEINKQGKPRRKEMEWKERERE